MNCCAAWRAQVKEICKLAGQRGATLMAAALAGIVCHMGRDIPRPLSPAEIEARDSGNGGEERPTAIPLTTIAVDGSMFLKYHKFKCAGLLLYFPIPMLYCVQRSTQIPHVYFISYHYVCTTCMPITHVGSSSWDRLNLDSDSVLGPRAFD